MSDITSKILTACGQAILKWPPQGEVSFCNCAVNFIASAAGYEGFKGLVANEIVDLMDKSPDFSGVTAHDAQNLANDGKLVIAGRKDEPHGHTCVIIPGGELVYSSKWKCNTPTCANVGKTNGVFGCNWAFSLEPGYYAWIG